MDNRLKRLSYSSNLLIHSCPRKFQLYKLSSKAESNDSDGSSNVTFAFGHIVGSGVQDTLIGKSESEIIWNMFLAWHADLEDRDDKRGKNFYKAVAAVQKFVSLRNNGYLKDYELLQYNSVPAVELSFCITFPDDFKYRGFVDAVLRNRITGEILVLEVKTTSGKVIQPAQFKNSAQAIGYSIVLDAIPETAHASSYKVLYLVYQTHSMEFTPLPFDKSYLQRALWIQELLLDIEMIKKYDEVGVFPMRGESCYSFYRECEYLNLCTLSTQHLTQPEPTELEPEVFQINVTLQDLITAQLSKEL